jgi:hypothetical protein
MDTDTMRKLFTCLTAIVFSAVAQAQTTQPASPAAGQPLQQSVPPPTPTALTDNAPRGVIPDVPSSPQIREGTHINKRTGKVSHSADGQQAIFTFDPDDKEPVYPPMVMEPNLKLLLLEGAVTPLSNDFAVSGTVLEYKGRNYLMLDNVPPGTIPERHGAPIVREGTHLTDQSGRLSHTASGQAIFTFDTDGKTVKDPPMYLLPNQKLEMMEGTVLGTAKDSHFRISGAVTEYKGKNYILLDKAVVVADVDQQM